MKNAKMSEYEEDSYAVFNGLRMLRREEKDGHYWWRGVVKHELGTVIFDQSTVNKASAIASYKYLHLIVIHEGREYRRYWHAWYGEKTIARLANEFITEIKGGAI